MANESESLAKIKKSRKEDALALAELIYDIYIEEKLEEQKAQSHPEESED